MLPSSFLLNIYCPSPPQTREIVELVVSGMQPLQSVVLIPKLGEAEWRKWSNHYIAKGFKGEHIRALLSLLFL